MITSIHKKKQEFDRVKTIAQAYLRQVNICKITFYSV